MLSRSLWRTIFPWCMWKYILYEKTKSDLDIDMFFFFLDSSKFYHTAIRHYNAHQPFLFCVEKLSPCGSYGCCQDFIWDSHCMSLALCLILNENGKALIKIYRKLGLVFSCIYGLFSHLWALHLMQACALERCRRLPACRVSRRGERRFVGGAGR